MPYRAPLRPSALLPLAILLLAAWRVHSAATRPPPFAFDAARPYRVVQVLDDGTLQLAGDVRVKPLGVSSGNAALQAAAFDAQAVEFTRRFIGDSPVTLQFDRERYDEFRRVLACVFVEDRCLNEALIRSGLRRVDARSAYSETLKRRFRAAEAEAREARRGLWGAGAAADRGAGDPASRDVSD